MNRSASLPVGLADFSAPGSPDPILRSEPGGQDRNPALGRFDILLAPPQRCSKIGQFCIQGLVIAVAHIGATRWPDLHMTVGDEHPDGGLGGVQPNPVASPKLPVRRYRAAWQACPADDLGAQNIGEPVARKTVQSLRHRTTITNRLMSDTHCRQSVGEGFGRLAAIEQFPRTYGWQVRSCRFGCPLMACRTCAAAGGDRGWGVSGVAAGHGGPVRRLGPFGPIRRLMSPGPGPGYPESLTAELPPEDEELLAAIGGREIPGTVKENRA